MNNRAYYQRNREIMLSRAKDYYEYDKEDIIICLKKRSKN